MVCKGILLYLMEIPKRTEQGSKTLLIKLVLIYLNFLILKTNVYLTTINQQVSVITKPGY